MYDFNQGNGSILGCCLCYLLRQIRKLPSIRTASTGVHGLDIKHQILDVATSSSEDGQYVGVAVLLQLGDMEPDMV